MIYVVDSIVAVLLCLFLYEWSSPKVHEPAAFKIKSSHTMIGILISTNSYVQIRMTFTDSFSWCELLRSTRGTLYEVANLFVVSHYPILVQAICFASLLSWDIYGFVWDVAGGVRM